MTPHRRWPCTRPLIAALLATVLCARPASAGCGDAPEPCTLPEGSYHLALPPVGPPPHPAIMLLHGHGGDGAGFLRNGGMMRRVLDRGYAVIAPDGQPRGGGTGRSWDFQPDRPATRDEAAFLVAVATDAAARFGLDRTAMLLAGFSVGGSMASYVACQAPDAFAAFAPVAGSFWRPHPARCAGPVRLFHTHGRSDRTVPLEGRAIRPDLVQGNVAEAMEIWAGTNRCPSAVTPATGRLGPYELHHRAGCLPGSDLVLALHDGGHRVPAGWADMVLDWFEDR